MYNLLTLFDSFLETCVKVGEGVFGEVFRGENENGHSIVLKVFVLI